jgi:hypothetical protein
MSPFANASRRPLQAGGRPFLYFGPLVAAYSGCRLSESCQLRVGDIKRIGGFAVIEIRRLNDADYAAELGAAGTPSWARRTA